jgi:hypothetical protein
LAPFRILPSHPGGGTFIVEPGSALEPGLADGSNALAGLHVSAQHAIEECGRESRRAGRAAWPATTSCRKMRLRPLDVLSLPESRVASRYGEHALREKHLHALSLAGINGVRKEPRRPPVHVVLGYVVP